MEENTDRRKNLKSIIGANLECGPEVMAKRAYRSLQTNQDHKLARNNSTFHGLLRREIPSKVTPADWESIPDNQLCNLFQLSWVC